MATEWRKVKGEWGFKYEVSNTGYVRNRQTGNVMKPCAASGYPTVTFCHQGERCWPKVHHLVLEAFRRKRPANRECNHIDGNVMNNKISNLEWVTHQYNVFHYQHVLKKRRTGEDHLGSKYSNKKIAQVRKLAHTMTHREISEKTGIPQSYVSLIICNKTRKEG